ncbi:MAG: aminodeoxychorismate synthase component I [Wenzhouxiangellaceae bacterium]
MSHYRALVSRPELTAVHAAAPSDWPFLLDSASRGDGLGRWSILMHADLDGPCLSAGFNDKHRFLDDFDRSWRASRRGQAGRFPFEGGWFVYLGYELAGAIEPTLQLPPARDRLPVACARRCRAAILHDHQLDQFWLVAEDPPLLERLAEELEQRAPVRREVPGKCRPRVTADDGQVFMDGVERIRNYILAGDVFQTNLSRAWHGRSGGHLDAVAIYRGLALRNPAPFAGLARLPGGTLLSSSPERLVSVRDGVIETRPIAGTRPRGSSPEQDRALSDELLAHPKERAEHIMLIDLERNDLGRICETGSVEVDELMVLESYAHVHHIVSNIRGRLEPGTSPSDVIRAVFPGGTITGCPKVRCMQIIAELETAGRSFYTGSMGYIGLDGRMDLNILIRSMLVSGSDVHFRTGAGIVVDSEPAAELAETEAKARGLIKALGGQ